MKTTPTVKTFVVKAKMVRKATCHKGKLYEIEYASGVVTNVYADDRASAIRKVVR